MWKACPCFADPRRVIGEVLAHGSGEKRYDCFGRVEGGVLTVRFTFRDDVVRIFGVGYYAEHHSGRRTTRSTRTRARAAHAG